MIEDLPRLHHYNILTDRHLLLPSRASDLSMSSSNDVTSSNPTELMEQAQSNTMYGTSDNSLWRCLLFVASLESAV